jgi:hypothetical protein
MTVGFRFSLCAVLLAFMTGVGSGQDAAVSLVHGPVGAASAASTGLVERAGDRSVILHWQPVAAPDVVGYHVYRAASPATPFAQQSTTLVTTNHFVDFAVDNHHTYSYRVRAVTISGQESADSATISATPRRLDDAAFLDLVQQTAFDYFWYETNPQNGLIKDRSTDTSPCNIAAVGFGLSALTVGIDRGWISREAGRARVHTTLAFLWHSPQGPEQDATGYKGFYYRFLDMRTGQRVWQSELSTVDTALLMGGVLHVQHYFNQDTAAEVEIRTLAEALYRRVDWTWMQVRPPKIGHGWQPETGFLPYDWSGYNEATILYLLALGSPTFPVSDAAWEAWTSTYAWQSHYGFDFVMFPPLFGHQYPHIWIDFRGIRDAYMRDKGIDYFENSRRATLANRAYAMANPMQWDDYSEHVWGMTASDSPTDYSARGAPPAHNDDGTITPTAPGGSFVFTPRTSLAALRYMYETYRTQLWGPYGYRDAFNPSEEWVGTDYLGIDQGPIVLMIENHRSGRIWEAFMQNAAIQRGLERAGFVSVPQAEKSQSVFTHPVQKAVSGSQH